MSDVIGTYSFLPWLRQGLANNIQTADLDENIKLRAAIAVDLELTGQSVNGGSDLKANVSRDVALYGPGDIVGIDTKVIVKNEPRHWITNFEPNYLPYIEFYDEDFPWRYTPAAPNTEQHRLRPWLALVVLKETEFQEQKTLGDRPLATFELNGDPQTTFPPAEQLWAWAHVHINKDLLGSAITSTNMEDVLSGFETLLGQNPDKAYSRILSPRKLEPDTGYHAFLIPTFESGRLAGIGREIPLDDDEFFATLSAWADYENRPDSTIYPYYYRWYFKTGTVGDFEHLVRLLKPRAPDSRLGRRDMDVQRPGSNIHGIANPNLHGVLRLEGALKVPDGALTGAEEAEAETYEEWDTPYPHEFQRQLAAFLNLPEDYATKTPEDAHADASDLDEAIQANPDPLITPPLYGRWHALTERLLFAADGDDVPQNTNWIHELNLDPRWRVAAGFGTSVVQDKQEDYMDAAWEQVGDIIEANRKLRQAQLAKEVAWIWYDRHLRPLLQTHEERAFLVMAPVQRRVMAHGLTVHHQVDRSIVPRAILSPTWRRITRPRDYIAKKLGFDTPAGLEDLITRINNSAISAAPPKVTPDTLPNVEAVSRELENSHDQYDVRPDTLPPEAIDELPRYREFEIIDVFNDIPSQEPDPGSADSPEAIRFKLALKDVFTLLTLSDELGDKPVKPPIDITGLSDVMFAALNPEVTVPKFTLSGLFLPAHITTLIGETFKEAMAYPEFYTPMYKALLDLSTEHFLPNIQYIKQDTVTLLETNQRFIEAYMVGLNHEFARELLWREYPTDQRGSYFRQFWDVSSFLDKAGLDKEELREYLKDIPPLHLWSRFSSLGDHDHREAQGAQQDDVVLVIRGQFLAKYPTATIYAHRARWQLDEEGAIDPNQERILDTTGNLDTKIKTPIYEAKVEPDIYFLGFDLTADEVKGGNGHGDDTDPGWFFVIKERPGEPRFGLDIERDGPLNVWNDLAWPDVMGDGDNGFLQIDAGTQTLNLTEPEEPELSEKIPQFEDDQALQWHADMNSAELAYILYQVPVLVAIHGSEMLPK